HRKLAPLVFVQSGELGGIELVVEQAAFAADQVGVKIVRLETIDDRGALAHAAIGELQDRHAGGGVFVFGKVLIGGTTRATAYALDLGAQAQQQSVQRVTARRQQTAATRVPAGVPTKLSIPRANAVIIICFAVVK